MPVEGIKMNKIVPYDKLSKKNKRRHDSLRRNSWGDIKPVTKRIESKKSYDRKKVDINDIY
jgi:hypothetical protein